MRRYFLAGLIVWVPILGTFYILSFIVHLLDSSLALLPANYHPDHLFGRHIPGVGLLLTLLVLFLTGLIATNILGKRIVKAWDALLDKIPLVRGVYNAIKQIITTLVNPGNKSFRKVLLLEYPRRGIWSIGFQTSTEFAAVPLAEDTLMVFIPTTPNPTSGFLTAIPKKDVIELDMGVDEALKVIISLGVVIPDKMAKDFKARTPAVDKSSDTNQG